MIVALQLIISLTTLFVSFTTLAIVVTKSFGERPDKDDSQNNGGVAKP